MADEKDMKEAKVVYETMCSALEEHEWKFKRFDDDMTISLGVKGDDLPMDIVMMVRADAKVVSLFSPVPFKIAEDKRVEAALAVCVANYGLVNGSFDYDIADGEIRFRVTSSYRESLIGGELFNYMLHIAINTVDKYNDRFLMISKGIINFEKFLELENEK